MKRTVATVLGCVLFTGILSAVGQVYETHDAEGNPVFSDTPAEGAEAVSVPHTNVSDPVQEGQVPGGAGSQDASAAGGDKKQGKVVVVGEGEDAQRENEFINNEGRREVRDAEKPVEVLEAEPRREVR